MPLDEETPHYLAAALQATPMLLLIPWAIPFRSQN